MYVPMENLNRFVVICVGQSDVQVYSLSNGDVGHPARLFGLRNAGCGGEVCAIVLCTVCMLNYLVLDLVDEATSLASISYRCVYLIGGLPSTSLTSRLAYSYSVCSSTLS